MSPALRDFPYTAPVSSIAFDPLLDPLNAEQRQAVLHTDGPVLILAGAGSGKTRTLTHRIARLLREGVPPWQILAVTFTNKAAREMQARIHALLRMEEGENLGPWSFGTGKLPVMGTFHSVCARILRRDIEHLGRDRSFIIYDSDDQEKLMKTVLQELCIDETECKARAALSYVSRFKSEALSPKDTQPQATSERMALIIRAYERYQKALAASNALDFDDLILETVRLFREQPDVLVRYQSTWRFLHVDEYQDTNHAQYLLITLLAQKEGNLCVIGDPDQSIYGFRGADIRNILEFEKDYPTAVRINLERNYRSTQPILSAADAVIAVNPNRPEKRMWTEQTDGAQVIVHEVSDERREAEEAIRAVRDALADGMSLSEQAILYRTHSQSRLFEEACMRATIPYRLYGGTKFYSRKEVKDALAYLTLLLNPSDTVGLLRVINVPSRKIGTTTIGKLQSFAFSRHLPLPDALRQAGAIPDLDKGVQGRIADFVTLIERLRVRAGNAVVSTVLGELLETLRMEDWLKAEEDGEERWQNLQELLTVTHKYDALPPLQSLSSFLEEAALVSEADRHGEDGADALTLMTLHLCKGLEFDQVIVVGCEEGLMPHSNSLLDRGQLEEERRLMYVGMTRARKRLRLLHAKNRFLWGQSKSNAPSRFLDDLPEEVIERRRDELLSAFTWAGAAGEARVRRSVHLSPFRQQDDFNQDRGDEDVSQDGEIEAGTRIEHPTFGRGTVQSMRGDIADIRFDTGKVKSLALSIAPLTKL